MICLWGKTGLTTKVNKGIFIVFQLVYRSFTVGLTP